MNDWNESNANDVAVDGKKAPTVTSDSSRFIIAWTNNYSRAKISIALYRTDCVTFLPSIDESSSRLGCLHQAVFDLVMSFGFAMLFVNDRCETSK